MADGQQIDLKAWIGKSETISDVATATSVAALSATLDRDPVRPAPGTPLPPLWHWLYFLPLHRQSEIGPDGHAKRGGFLPPVPLPRRMWAASQFAFHAPLVAVQVNRGTESVGNAETPLCTAHPAQVSVMVCPTVRTPELET